MVAGARGRERLAPGIYLARFHRSLNLDVNQGGSLGCLTAGRYFQRFDYTSNGWTTIIPLLPLLLPPGWVQS